MPLVVLFMLLNKGLSDVFTTRFFQIGGLLASFLSVSKICTEWHIYTAFNLHHKTYIKTKFLTAIKGMLFFTPHVVFRTASISIIAAFFRLYSLIPLSIFIAICLPVVTKISRATISFEGIIESLLLLLECRVSLVA